jgi:hypothetical protein
VEWNEVTVTFRLNFSSDRDYFDSLEGPLKGRREVVSRLDFRRVRIVGYRLEFLRLGFNRFFFNRFLFHSGWLFLGFLPLLFWWERDGGLRFPLHGKGSLVSTPWLPWGARSVSLPRSFSDLSGARAVCLFEVVILL